MTNFIQRFQLPAFPVDGGSLDIWCAANVPGYVSSFSDSSLLKLTTTAALNKTQSAVVLAYLLTLTQNGEATKLALPHNLIGMSKLNFENLVKAKIATLTWDSMSAAQKTFSMGGSLSGSDYDSLPTS
jgi:hypothetical protein